MSSGKIYKVSGPLVLADGMENANMFDMVRVGKDNLIGEVIEMRGGRASIQVYEETAGLGPGAEVTLTGAPLSVELGPGMIGGIYDGIQRPLDEIVKIAGTNIGKGISVPALSREKKWKFTATAKIGQAVIAGDVLGVVNETSLVIHKILVPLGMDGTVTEIADGEYSVEDTVGVISTKNGRKPFTLMQKWPVRRGRPYAQKLSPDVPMLTGQRIIDTFFPVAKGGTAAVPGPFGSGKTVVQHQLAKWSDVDIVVYIGCGERGNEMTDVLNEFPELIDPRSGESLIKRTVLIANTSDMPVAAREASIYTGITIAEYFRDMGYSVAIMADSTSRWAEALREMSGRLEEMPGEEGYPTYLTSRLAQFYERAGRVKVLGSEGKEGSLTAIGAVSPTGGDISEPVSQATLRIVKVFWSLDSSLAYRRHFPAINWLNSYSLYQDTISEWTDKNVSPDFARLRTEAMKLLQLESELDEIVKLVGIDALSPSDRLILEVARSIREDYLQQNAFSDTDSYTSFEKQLWLMKIVLSFYEAGMEAIERNVDINELFSLSVREAIGRAKDLPEKDFVEAAGELIAQIRNDCAQLSAKGM